MTESRLPPNKVDEATQADEQVVKPVLKGLKYITKTMKNNSYSHL